ncbi:MAG: hypothetical protein V4612_06155 [Pseudomonadota bacterium]
MTGPECLEYRVFYNKSRFKKVDAKIFSFAGDSNKINYGGDIEIDWVPEIFQVTDLFLLGHLGNGDGGSFSMRITEDYPGYVEFMKNTYGFGRDKLNNSFNKNINQQLQGLLNK